MEGGRIRISRLPHRRHLSVRRAWAPALCFRVAPRARLLLAPSAVSGTDLSTFAEPGGSAVWLEFQIDVALEAGGGGYACYLTL